MKQNLEIYYDKEADILEITIGKPSSCVFDEVDEGIFEAHDIETNELKGYKIFDFLKRGGMKDIKIPLPANISISWTDGLMKLRFTIRLWQRER